MANFEAYWAYSLQHDGDYFKMRKILSRRETRSPASRLILFGRSDHWPIPPAFYRNHVTMRDNPTPSIADPPPDIPLRSLRRHEYVGISSACGGTEPIAEVPIDDRKDRLIIISARNSITAAFFRRCSGPSSRPRGICPLGKWMSPRVSHLPLFPEAAARAPAFVSELMGLTVYQHIDGVLDDTLHDEPEARERVRTLLRGSDDRRARPCRSRRNFLGHLGLRVAHRMVESMYRAFSVTSRRRHSSSTSNR